MRRLTSGLVFLATLVSGVSTFAQQPPPAAQPGLVGQGQAAPAGQPPSQVSGAGPALIASRRPNRRWQ